ISKAIFTAMVFMFIENKEDYILQPIFMSMGYLVCGAFAIYLIVMRWKVKIHPPEWQSIKNTIRGSSDVFVNNIIPNVYNSFSVVLLGFLGGNISNGLLDAGQKFVSISHQFLAVVSRVFFPFLSRKINRHNVYTRLHLSLAFISSAVLIATAPFIIDLF